MGAERFDNFIGGSYSALTRNLAADTCVNLFYESAESGTGKNRAALIGAPGLQAFLTLPQSPIRGVYVGNDAFWAVAGATLYQIFADGTTNVRGNVGDDAAHSPVQMFDNGAGQIVVVSAGALYVDAGGPGGSGIPLDWIEATGAVNVSGTAVTLISGFKFPVDAAGQPILISGVTYTVASVTDSTHLVLSTSGGTQSGVLYFGGGGPAPANYQNGSGTVTTAGTAVTWVSGDQFDASNVGNIFYINGVRYTVASVTDATHLVLTASAGTQGSTFTGTCDTLGTAVTWDSGTLFTSLVAGQIITIASVPYVIASITDSTHLVLASTAPTASAASWSAVDGVPYTSAYPVTASCGAFLDGYFIISPVGTRNIQISAIGDAKSWNPLDFAVKEAYPDGIVNLLADHEQLWIFGSQTIEVWQDTGAAAFPFQRIPGAFVQMGLVAFATPTRVGGTVCWIGGDARGRAVAYAANGFIPERISTHAVETAWNQTGVAVGDAIAFAYTDEGHEFWVITFPSSNATWVYDFTEKLWHQRGWWDGTNLNRTRYIVHGFVFDRHIVGDWESGELYYLDLAVYDDDGAPIYHERAAPHVSGPMLGLANPSGTSTNSPFQNNQTFYHRFVLDMEAGDGSGGVLADGYTTSWVGQTTVIVSHNLGTLNVCIQVFDTSKTIFEPETVTIIDANTVQLTFGAPFSGSVMVIEGNPGTTSATETFTNTPSVNFPHNLNTTTIIVNCYNAAGLQVQPETLTVTGPNTVLVTFPAAFSGKIVVIKGAFTASWFGQTSVIATHNLGTTAVEVQCFSVGGLLVEPETLQVTGINTVLLKFAAPFNGYVVVWASQITAQPFIILDWSDDGGHNFGIEHTTTTGLPGAYTTRVIWRRLGKSRDRVFRVRYLCKGKTAWINAYLESTAGSM